MWYSCVISKPSTPGATPFRVRYVQRRSVPTSTIARIRLTGTPDTNHGYARPTAPGSRVRRCGRPVGQPARLPRRGARRRPHVRARQGTRRSWSGQREQATAVPSTVFDSRFDRSVHLPCAGRARASGGRGRAAGSRSFIGPVRSNASTVRNTPWHDTRSRPRGLALQGSTRGPPLSCNGYVYMIVHDATSNLNPNPLTSLHVSSDLSGSSCSVSSLTRASAQ